MGISQPSVWRTQGTHAHLPRAKTAIFTDDYPCQADFVQWMLGNNDPQFSILVLSNDEAKFRSEDISTCAINMFGLTEIPIALPFVNTNRSFSWKPVQASFVINWQAITSCQTVWPKQHRVFPWNMCFRIHRRLFHSYFQRDIRFKHDWAPAYFSIMVHNFLNTTYLKRCIGPNAF